MYKSESKNEIRCSPHTCSHYYAQFMLKQNLDIYTVSRLLGHSNIDITKIYLQSIKDNEIVEMNNMISPLIILNNRKRNERNVISNKLEEKSQLYFLEV